MLALFALAIVPTHLRLDDWGYILGCPFVKGGLTWANLARAFSDFGHGGLWMPLTYASYMADITLFGGGWRVHHAVNVVLHAVNALLVYRLLLALLAPRPAQPSTLNPQLSTLNSQPSTLNAQPSTPTLALFAALVWALHPLRAEAVAWVASRKEELWTLFTLAASLGWLAFCRRGGWGRYLAVMALFACACLSKPTAVCFPVLAFFIARYVANRDDRDGKDDKDDRDGNDDPNAGKGCRRPGVCAYLPMLFVSLVVGLIALYAQTHPTGMERVAVGDTTFAWRALNAAVSLGLYVWHTLVPVGLHIDYRAVPGRWPLDGALGLTVLGLVSVAVVAALVRRRGPQDAGHETRGDTDSNLKPQTSNLKLSLAWFFVTLLPVLGLLGLTGDKAYADRYTYMPAVGLSLLLAAVLSARLKRIVRWHVAVALAVLAAEAALAVPAIRGYRDDRAAYARVLAADPDHWRGLRTLGCDYCALQNRQEEGIAMLRRSLALRPSKLTADSLAYVLACRGASGDADEVRALGRVVAADPRRDPGGLMLDALGLVAFQSGEYTNAVKFLSAALVAPARSHGNVHTMLNLGLALMKTGRVDEAREILGRLDRCANADVRRRAAEALATFAAR